MDIKLNKKERKYISDKTSSIINTLNPRTFIRYYLCDNLNLSTTPLRSKSNFSSIRIEKSITYKDKIPVQMKTIKKKKRLKK